MDRREGRPRQVEVAVWLVAVGAVACSVTALVLHASNAARVADLGEVYMADVWVSLAVPPVGAYLLTRTHARLLGWLLLSTVALSVGALSAMYAIHVTLTDPDGSFLGSLCSWLATWTWTPFLVLVVVVPLLLPDGRPASRRWRLVVRLALGGVATVTVGSAFAPGALVPFPRLHNPLGIDALTWLPAFTRGLIATTVAVFVPLALFSMVLRWRRAESAAERRRAGWVLAALMVLAVTFFGMEIVPYPWNDLGPALGITVVIAALVFAVVSSETEEHHRLVHEQLVGAREDERFRIHRDLHDGLGPELAGLALHLNAIGAAADDPVRDRLAAAEETLRRTVDEVRRIVDDLRPPALDQLGLVGAVNERAAALSAASGVDFELHAGGCPATLPPAVEVAAYRIACEAMTNVARHADAGRCVVRLGGDRTHLRVDVNDDGCGVGTDPPLGIGTTTMRARAEELGGRITRGAGLGGRGFGVSAHLPLVRA